MSQRPLQVPATNNAHRLVNAACVESDLTRIEFCSALATALPDMRGEKTISDRDVQPRQIIDVLRASERGISV